MGPASNASITTSAAPIPDDETNERILKGIPYAGRDRASFEKTDVANVMGVWTIMAFMALIAVAAVMMGVRLG